MTNPSGRPSTFPSIFSSINPSVAIQVGAAMVGTGVLLASLPLKEGLRATFPTLSEDRDELDWITVAVGKQELVDAGPGKQVMAWPVDTEGNYANKSHSIFGAVMRMIS